MKLSTRKKGNLAEEKALDFLKKRGFEILEKNFRTPWGEIDLIAKKGKILCFIEVKSASSDPGIVPEEKVNFTKQNKISKVAEFYILKNSKNLSKIKEIRFDVIVINWAKDEVKHYESAFYTEKITSEI
ncbi:MAG: YraN family protein [Caldimicrobium sp.]